MSCTDPGQLLSEHGKRTSFERDQCLLFSLPFELREEIYLEIFATLRARCRSAVPINSLAILQTCTQINKEASTVLYNRTALHMIIGHSRYVTSTPPPAPITSRFQHISFVLIRMTDTFPAYLFEAIWDDVAPPFVDSSVPRKSCTIRCELVEYAGSASSALLKHVKSFTAFETLSITFKGKLLKKMIPHVYLRQREEEALVGVKEMLHSLEEYLGKGSLIDVSEDLEVVNVWMIVFHPLRLVKQTQ